MTKTPCNAPFPSTAALLSGLRDGTGLPGLFAAGLLAVALLPQTSHAASDGTGPEQDAKAAAPTVIEVEQSQVPTAGQSRKVSFDIPAQSLAGALTAFGRAAGLQVSVDHTDLAGLESKAVLGEMTARDALARLLRGTGVTYRFTDEKTVVLEKPAQSGDRLTLGTVAIEGRAVPRQADVGNPFPAYAGGQVATGGKLGILGGRGVMDTPFNQTSYTDKLMEDQQSQYVADTLRNDPAVQVPGPPSGGADQYTIRGFLLTNADVLFNGMGVVAPSFANSMPSEGLERVEVLKGPNALLNGMTPQNTVGGAINLVPKRAGEAPLTRLTPDYTNNSQFGGHIDVGRRFGDDKEFGVRFNGVYRDGDAAIDHQTYETRLAAMALDYRLENVRLEADLGYQYQRQEGKRRVIGVSTGVAVPNAPDPSANYSHSWELGETQFYYGALRGEVDITPEVTAFAAIGANRRHRGRIDAYRTVTNSDGDFSTGNATLRGELSYAFSAEGGVRGDFSTGPVDHRATLAYTHSIREWYFQNSSYSVVASNLYNPVYTAAPQSGLASPSDVKKYNDVVFNGVILADTMSFLDDRIQITGGGRYQELNVTTYDTSTEAVNGGYVEDAITPLGGIIVKPVDNVSLYANYIEGLTQGSSAPDTANNADEVLPPYKTEQFEAGVKWDMGRLTATLSAYQISLPNAYTDPDTNIYGLNGKQRNRGVELNVFGEAAEDIRVLGGVSYIKSEQIDTETAANEGNRGIGVPKFNIVVGGEWDLPQVQGLTLTGRMIHQTDVYRDAANAQNVDGFTRFDIGARYTIVRQGGEPIVSRANIENRFNAGYWTGDTNGSLALSDPRTFKLSASFDF